MSMPAADTFVGLLLVVDSQDAEDGGHRHRQIQLQDTIGNRPAHIFKMRRIPAKYTPKCDKGLRPVVLVFMCIPVCADGEGDLECSGNGDHMGTGARFSDFRDGPFLQGVYDGGIPFRTDYNYTGILKVRNACCSL